MKLTPEQILQNEKKVWTRSAPADLYYQRDYSNPTVSNATPKLVNLLDRFQSEILDTAKESRNAQPKVKYFCNIVKIYTFYNELILQLIKPI